MCGIAAALPANMQFVRAALQEHESRGPDHSAAVDLGFCALGINRLAISGVKDGNQPLRSSDGRVSVIFNGAIYNFEELLTRFDLHAPTKNDGEIIHLLYEQVGLEFADYLEGMFAICIADTARQTIVVAVDQVGIKPLYWLRTDDSWLVASTIGAFPADLRSRVRRVPPGTVWSSAGEMRRIVHRTAVDGTLGELLSVSVAQQIPGEVPWGCLLSGGVDSSLIARLARDYSPAVRTFTCGTRTSSDLLAARETAEFLGTEHYEEIVDPDELPSVIDAVIKATGSFEPWTVMGGTGTYLAARCARRNGVKVLLSGEGADEMFGGYDEFIDVPPIFLNSLLLQYQIDLGVTECLRLDRCTMAHSIEARVPYLSTSLMRFSRMLSAEDKLRKVGGEVVRKFALREHARTLLPDHIAYRRKEEFTVGSGLTDEISKLADKLYSPSRVIEIARAHPSFPVNGPLAAWFVDRWSALYGMSIGRNWHEMVDRGLFRQAWTPYQPNVVESGIYGQ